MKSFVKKVTVLAVAFSMASSTLANAQEEDGKQCCPKRFSIKTKKRK